MTEPLKIGNQDKRSCYGREKVCGDAFITGRGGRPVVPISEMDYHPNGHCQGGAGSHLPRHGDGFSFASAFLGGVVFIFLLMNSGWMQAQNPAAETIPLVPLRELPKSTWRQPSVPQIIGGTLADPGEYPWQVALVEAVETNPYEGMFCGGSLIGIQWVLTAAHCVYEQGVMIHPTEVEVVLGIVTLSDGPRSGTQGQRLAVDKIIPYPGYNDSNLENDIALIHLTSPAVLGPLVSTIVPAGPLDSSFFAPDVNATVTGWGTVDGNNYPDDLYEVTLPIVSNSICDTAMGGVTAGMLCAGPAAGGKDSCNGDSGGPLTVPKGCGNWLLAGIVSWGPLPCAQANQYGVYTRVSSYHTWIRRCVGAIIYLPLVIR